MTDKYTDEALRRLKQAWGTSSLTRIDDPDVKCLAAALLELGWEPPVDPMLIKAREIVARCAEQRNNFPWAKDTRAGLRDSSLEMQIALAALKDTDA